MSKTPSVFISYSSKNKEYADPIDEAFKHNGIRLIRDMRDVAFKDSFREFMRKIRETSFALLVISDDFLKSRNCMYEVIEFFKDNNYREKLFLDIPDPLNATLDEIDTYLKTGKHDVLQITAHGTINENGEGALLFEDARGDDITVTATELAKLRYKQPRSRHPDHGADPLVLPLLAARETVCHRCRKTPQSRSARRYRHENLDHPRRGDAVQHRTIHRTAG